MEELIALAEKLAQLAPTALFALLIALLVVGKFRLEREVTAATQSASEDIAQRDSDLAYRETLRLEAIADRRASDDRVAKLTSAIEESNRLTRQSIELTEKMVGEVLKTSTRRRATNG